MSITVEIKDDSNACKSRNKIYLDILKDGQDIELYVRGTSMYPFIKDYDLLKIKPLGDNSLRLGDIILVSQGGADSSDFFIHRLVKIVDYNGQGRYYTKGDNSFAKAEGPFRNEQIKGRVVTIRRKNINFNLRLSNNSILNAISTLLSIRFPRLLKIINSLRCVIDERSILLLKISKRLRSKNILSFNSHQLLIILSKNNLDDYYKEMAISLVKEGLHWNDFCKMAISSGRTIFMLRNLKILQSSIDIPPFVIERLEMVCLEIITKSEKNYNGLLYILKNFSEARIPAIPLKGTFLSGILYGDISLRGASTDIDLLIREQDEKKACQIMQSLGYQERGEREIDAWRWHRDFFREGISSVDLHWDITMTNRNIQRSEGLWKGVRRARVVKNGEVTDYFQWPQETLLIFLCVNLINSKGYRGLRGLFDIDALIGNSKVIDWEAIVFNSYKYKANNSVYAGLIKSRQILDTKVPQFILKRLRPSTIKRLLINLFFGRSVIFESNFRRKIMDGFLSYIFFELLEAGSFGDYLKIIKRVFFPPPEVLELSYINNLMQGSSKINSKFQYAICILKRFARSFGKISSLLLR